MAGALVGGIVFTVWSMISEFAIAPALQGRGRLEAAIQAGSFLKEARMPFGLFFLIWLVSLFAIS